MSEITTPDFKEKLAGILDRMKTQEESYPKNPDELVKPSWELAKAMLEDEICALNAGKEAKC